MGIPGQEEVEMDRQPRASLITGPLAQGHVLSAQFTVTLYLAEWNSGRHKLVNIHSLCSHLVFLYLAEVNK